MKNRISSLPLLVVVAVVALVIGSLGTAVAAPALTKAKVKSIATQIVNKKAPTLSVANAVNATNAAGVPDNAINSADVANGTLVRDDFAAGAVPTVLFARISSAGGVTAGFGVVSSVRNSTGNYTVTFNRNVTACAALVTVFGSDQEVYFVSSQTAGGAVTVDIELPDTSSTQQDSAFNLGVLC
jgi:hypothetical protein